MRRQLGFVVGVTEYLLDRPVRSVLDVGCGEGNWAAVLRGIRPRARYLGVDGSEYAIRRFG
ncbi:MAG: class I SAM-dependent methyltransferase, partial [Gemmatimonadaceae bacterium]|nr:class I SAM-dependent methyltransferase [Gemmatimonadaceae bacterium]